MNIQQSLSNIYLTLSQLEIKASPNNVKYLFGIQNEIQQMIDYLQENEKVGD